jgi:hypothetical protein
MFLKISLIVAILVGVGTLFVTHEMVAPKISEMKETLTNTQKERDDSRQAEAKAKNEAKTNKMNFEAVSKQFNEATNALLVVSTELRTQKQRADKASSDLEERTRERNESRDELAQWKALGYDVVAIRSRLNQVAGLEAERNVLADENKLLDRNLKLAKQKLDHILGLEEPVVELPPGTKGKIVAVDPKYDFVILNIGAKEGVLPNAKMMVNRDGKLIGKVKITSVEPNRSIANVMPEWKQDEIMEGDQVLF